MNKRLLVLSITAAVTVMTGCGATATKPSSQDTNTANSVDLQNRLTERESELEARDNQITELKRMLAMQHGGETSSVASFGDLLPPNAKPGECYARVFIPPSYKTEDVKILKKEGYDVVEVVPAQYKTEEKSVLAKEATETLKIIPAVYGWKEEQVLVSPEIKELRKVEAVYETQTEEVLVKPAHSIWKKGSGPITKVDSSTGEIMCLVEVPAVYKIIKKRVLVSPETTKEVVVKAPEYKTVKTKVVTTPAKTIKTVVPAEYVTVKVTSLTQAATTTKRAVGPVYDKVTKRIKTEEGRIEWAPILCETNVTGDVVRELQSRLNELGYNAGPVDSLYGWQTTAAVKKYQKDKGLAEGGQLTLEVLDSLGINHG